MTGPGPVAATLGQDDLDALLPHTGRSRLIRRVLSHDAERIVCEGVPPADPAHPLRIDGTLPPTAAIEYGAQAMAIHGALAGGPPRGGPRLGYLFAVREIRFGVDGLEATAGPVVVEAERVFTLGDQVSYGFTVRSGDGTLLVDGRANVHLGAGAAGPSPRG